MSFATNAMRDNTYKATPERQMFDYKSTGHLSTTFQLQSAVKTEPEQTVLNIDTTQIKQVPQSKVSKSVIDVDEHAKQIENSIYKKLNVNHDKSSSKLNSAKVRNEEEMNEKRLIKENEMLKIELKKLQKKVDCIDNGTELKKLQRQLDSIDAGIREDLVTRDEAEKKFVAKKTISETKLQTAVNHKTKSKY